MVLVYAAPKLNSSLVTNVLFVQLEDVEEVLMHIDLDPPPCILGSLSWKSAYLFIFDLFTHFKARPISQTPRFDIPS